MKIFKLMVWKDVLCDYTCGMIVAFAPDMETALRIADDWRMREEMGSNVPETVEVAVSRRTKPAVWSTHGGG